MDQFLQDIFNKAKEESKENSLRKWAEYITDYLADEVRYPLSVKTMERYYNGYTRPNMEKKNKLSMFLGYKDYSEYLCAKKIKEDRGEKEGLVKENDNPNKKKYFVFLMCLMFLLILGAGYLGYSSGREDCMIWEDDHYELTTCEGRPGETEKNSYLLENFKQIQVSDTTTFFKNGRANVWYDKQNNEIYYFSSPGINPETGKTVKAITNYMIQKYIKVN